MKNGSLLSGHFFSQKIPGFPESADPALPNLIAPLLRKKTAGQITR
mgnify:CR=1 FL=1